MILDVGYRIFSLFLIGPSFTDIRADGVTIMFLQVCLLYKEEGRRMRITVTLTNGIVPSSKIGLHMTIKQV